MLVSADGFTAVLLLVYTLTLLLGCGQTTRTGFVLARLIRHTLLFLAITKVSLAVSMILTAFGSPLMFAIGHTVTHCARLIAAALAAVELATEAGPADTEHRPAPAALSRKERDAPARRHRSRKRDSTATPELWDAQAVTV